MLSDTPVSLLSILLFAIGIAVTVVVARVLRAGVTRFLEGRSGAPAGVSYAIGRIVQYLVTSAGVLVCLDTLGVDLATLAALGALLSVGIGFGLQNIAQNFISGVILLIERPIQKGDFVTVGDMVGTVTDIEMRATKIVSRDGVMMIIPNSEFISGRVINQSYPTTRKRVHVTVGVAYGSDTAIVREALLEDRPREQGRFARPQTDRPFQELRRQQPRVRPRRLARAAGSRARHHERFALCDRDSLPSAKDRDPVPAAGRAHP